MQVADAYLMSAEGFATRLLPQRQRQRQALWVTLEARVGAGQPVEQPLVTAESYRS